MNDFINTTLGGIAFGEMFHRVGWLVRDTRATGTGRRWREIGAMAVDQLTGYNRFRSGDASRITDKPPDMVPSSLTGFASAGVLWRGSETRAFAASGSRSSRWTRCMEMSRAAAPGSRMRHSRCGFGLAAARVSAKRACAGGCWESRWGGGKTHFVVMQSYDYQSNDAYATGAQSLEAAVAVTQALPARINLAFMGWGGPTVLGAIDSLPLGITERPDPPPDSGAGQGVSEGPRYYDYGPGSTFGAVAQFSRDRLPFATLFYEGRHLYSLDGVRANHFLQRTRLDLLLPLRGAIGLGVSGEYFFRQSFYQDEDNSQLEYRYPQFRAYFTWRIE